MFDSQFYEALPASPDEALLSVLEAGLRLIDESGSDFDERARRWRSLAAAVNGIFGEMGETIGPLGEFGRLRLDEHQNESTAEWVAYIKGELETKRAALAFRTRRGVSDRVGAFELTPDYRDAVRAHTRKIRGILNQAEIDADLRQALLHELTKFELDLDRDRTRVDGLIRLWMKMTKAVGDGFENLGPAIDQAERIAAIFGGILSAPKALPKPPPKITGPKNLDDEIPF